MHHYIKFMFYFVTVLVGSACLVLAEHWIIVGATLFVGFYVLGDAFMGNDTSTPNLQQKSVLNIMLAMSVPCTLILLVSGLWLVTPYEWPIMHQLSSISGYDFVLAKQQTSILELGLAAVFSGLMLSGVATVVAHELVHKVGNKWAVTTGRCLLSMSFDANFSIEHVYNHHAYVATHRDPVTAPRGRNVYVHIVLATIGTNISAWQIEKKRLARAKKALFSVHNRCLRGYAMSLVYVCGAAAVASWQGSLFVIVMGITAKILLEIVNYMEHYGLVRDIKQAVQAKHSWNNNRKISCWTMFNLPRHSHHHAKGALAFDKLEPMPDAPVMIGGYISTIGLTLIPPLWFYLMAPKLAHWDKHHANAEELALLHQQASCRLITKSPCH